MIPILDLKKQYHSIKKEIDARLQEILESGIFILGPNVKSLEKEIADFCTTKFAVGVASGTDALELALQALGIKGGDEVITTPFTFIATTEAILQIGAKIVFADIDPITYNIHPADIKNKLTRKTKAIIPVHLYGQPCQMDEILKYAKEYKFSIIEDCAQAIGAEYAGRRVGSFGNIGCFSFFPTKNLGGYGDGGMVVTNDENIAEKIKILRVHGSKNKYFHILEGRNSRLDEIQAGILRIKLKYLNEWNTKRAEKAALYNDYFVKAGLQNEITLPRANENTKHVYHIYVIRVKQRDELVEFLKSKGVSTAVNYPLPLHLQEVYKKLGYRSGDFPNSELAAKQVVSLPIYPELTSGEIELIVSLIKEFYAKKEN